MDEPSNSIYDESSFPANAESESDTEKVVGSLETNKIKSRAPLGGDRGVAEAALSDDIMCVVCAEILVEPCSLHCGHSFCQLCLASLWKSCQNKSPLYLKCPVCRQPWVNFPGVNIQLRNIIEKSHKSLVDLRHTRISESDKVTLNQFKIAKDGEWQKERQQNRQRPRPALLLITLLFIFCGLITITTTVIFSMVAFSEKSSEYVQKPVVQWSNADVMDWLSGLGDWATDQNISRVFLKEKISGAQLKLLNHSTLKTLGIHVDYFKTQSLLLAIEELKQKDYLNPRNFNEFMAAHRRKTVLLGVLYKLWPRFTFFYMYLFEYHDMFLPILHFSVATQKLEEDTASPRDLTSRQMFVFGFEILLVPHYVVGLFAWQWLTLHPWISTAIIAHCLWATQSDAKKGITFILTATAINWKPKFMQAMRMFLQSVLKFVFTVCGSLVIWPIVPYFLCDGVFYLVLWNTVYTHLWAVSLKLFLRRRRRVNRGQNAIP